MASFTEFRVEGELEPTCVYFFSTLRYRLGQDIAIGIEQDAAWCEGCQAFEAAEYVPSVEELNERMRDLQKASDKRDFLYPTRTAVNHAIAELRVRINWRLGRTSPPRCLVCGSTRIILVDFDEKRSCVIHGKHLSEVTYGFADTDDWIAEYSPEGLLLPSDNTPPP